MDRLNDLFLLLARWSFAALFLPDGIGKLETFSRFAESLGRRGLPFPDLWAAAAVIGEILGSLLFIVGAEIRLGAILLIAFCLIANALQHRYWESPPEARTGNFLSFYKNLALCGGMLALMVTGPGKLGVERWLPWRRNSR
jgi:putative oxidoreductase